MAVDHTCPVAWAQDHGLLAGTPVEASWCLSYKHDLVRALAEPNPMDLGLLLWHDGPLSAFYAPWDWVNTSAKIMLVGITPGAAQAAKGLREAQRCLREGLANEETLRRANAVGSFSGPMRANLVTMLDGIGLGGVLGIDSTARLFDTHPHLAAKTSAISYPVFVNGQNYGGGNPSLIRHPALRSLVRASLGPRVAMAAGALVIPLGTAAQDAVMLPTADGLLDRGRCLLGFPHPSGANGWRVRQYTARRETLREEVAHWAAMTTSGPLRTVLADAPRQPTRAAPVIRHRLPAHSTRRSRRTEEAGMANSRASGGTPLNSHQQTNVHALLVSCPYCGAKPGERCQGAQSHPDGYRDTLHKDRESELDRKLDAATAGLTRTQAGAVRRLFINPPTAEERRAVAAVLLRPERNR